MKPADWPRYMETKRLAGGRAGYFWRPRKADREAGCALEPQPLGTDYGAARARANELNAALDAWRTGKGGLPVLMRVGTVDWWLHLYRKSRAWKKLRPRSRGEYERHLRIIAELPVTKPSPGRRRVGELPVIAMTPAAADRLYDRLLAGGVGRLRADRVRQAAFELDILKIAWRAVQRLHPEMFPKGNPFEGLTREARGTRTKKPATAAEAYALAAALRDAGHAGLGAAALICFEWHQRPENVIAGATTWPGYRLGEAVRIEHWKTRGIRAAADADDDRYFWLELRDVDGPLYPEIEAFLATVPRLGTPIALRAARGRDGEIEGRLYTRRNAHAVVKRVRDKAGLPLHVTLAACRHGGLTELGDAGITEAEGMALSDHSTPDAFRLYVKKTATQRLAGARKRRAWRARDGG